MPRKKKPIKGTKVYVNISKKTPIAKIKAKCSLFGSVLHAYHPGATGAIVVFKHLEDAKKAVIELDGEHFLGTKLQCGMANPKNRKLVQKPTPGELDTTNEDERVDDKVSDEKIASYMSDEDLDLVQSGANEDSAEYDSEAKEVKDVVEKAEKVAEKTEAVLEKAEAVVEDIVEKAEEVVEEVEEVVEKIEKVVAEIVVVTEKTEDIVEKVVEEIKS